MLRMSFDLKEVMLKHLSCFILLVVILGLHIPVLIFFLRHLIDKYCKKKGDNRAGGVATGTIIKWSRNAVME